jgi:trimethylamine:corrinoid methyltransferase-like protein
VNEIPVASRLIDRGSFGDWEARGAQSAEARAAGEVERILAQSDDAHLDGDRLAQLTEIMTAEARANGLDALPR